MGDNTPLTDPRELMPSLFAERFCDWFRIKRAPPLFGCKICHTLSKDKTCPLDKKDSAHD